MNEREAALVARLQAMSSLVVAYSGGVDSAYLAWIGTRVLGAGNLGEDVCRRQTEADERRRGGDE